MVDTLPRSKHAMPQIKGAIVEFMVVIIPQNSCVMIFLLIIHRVTLARRGLLEKRDTWQVLFLFLTFMCSFTWNVLAFTPTAAANCKFWSNICLHRGLQVLKDPSVILGPEVWRWDHPPDDLWYRRLMLISFTLLIHFWEYLYTLHYLFAILFAWNVHVWSDQSQRQDV